MLHERYKQNLDSIKKLFEITGKNIYFYGSYCDYDLRIKRLLIPNPTIVLRDFSSRKHALVTRQFLDLWAPIEGQNSQDTEWSSKGSSMPLSFKNRLLYRCSKMHPEYSKLWLSRTQFNKCSRALPEERQIEKILSEMGWKIIHPQQHSIRTQLNAL